MSTIHSSFSSQFFASNFSSVLIVFHHFFTWIALGGVDLHFSLILVARANAVEEEITWAVCLYHQHSQSVHVTDGVIVTSLSASLLQKMSTAMDCLCQITLNQKSSLKFEKWCKFSSHVKAKMCKKESHKTRPACNRRYSQLFSKHHL